MVLRGFGNVGLSAPIDSHKRVLPTNEVAGNLEVLQCHHYPVPRHGIERVDDVQRPPAPRCPEKPCLPRVPARVWPRQLSSVHFGSRTGFRANLAPAPPCVAPNGREPLSRRACRPHPTGISVGTLMAKSSVVPLYGVRSASPSAMPGGKLPLSDISCRDAEVWEPWSPSLPLRSGPWFRSGPASNRGRSFFWSPPTALPPWLPSHLSILPSILFVATVLPHCPLAGGKTSRSSAAAAQFPSPSLPELFVSPSDMAFPMSRTRQLRPVRTRYGPSRFWSHFVTSAVTRGTLRSAGRLLPRRVVGSGRPPGTQWNSYYNYAILILYYTIILYLYYDVSITAV